jgi:sterol 3beta-glucosyltransferase
MIVFVTSGTRGDVQPYVVEARRRQQAGQAVAVATHRAFEPLVTRAGVPFLPLADNPSDWLVRNPGALTPARPLATVRYLRAVRPLQRRLIDSAMPILAQASQIVAGLSSLWVGPIAAVRDIPVTWAFLQPLTPTRHFAISVLPFRVPGALNRLSYALVDRAISLQWGGTALLSRATRGEVINVFDPVLVPPPADWPTGHKPVGFWLDAPAPLPDDVLRFLDRATRPVYFGAGAGSVRDATQMRNWAARLGNDLGVQVLLNTGEAPGLLSADVLVVRDVSHAALFPRLHQVIHHGGAGTTGAAQAAGVRSVITPVFADQFFWELCARSSGIEARPLPMRTLTYEALRQRVQDAN